MLTEVAKKYSLHDVYHKRDCVWVAYHFIAITHFGAVTRIRLALVTTTDFVTRHIEAVVPWHVMVPRKGSEFIRRNVFLL